MESDARWESTLMGAAFWRAQEKNNTFDANHHGHYSGTFYKRVSINCLLLSASCWSIFTPLISLACEEHIC